MEPQLPPLSKARGNKSVRRHTPCSGRTAVGSHDERTRERETRENRGIRAIRLRPADWNHCIVTDGDSSRGGSKEYNIIVALLNINALRCSFCIVAGMEYRKSYAGERRKLLRGRLIHSGLNGTGATMGVINVHRGQQRTDKESLKDQQGSFTVYSTSPRGNAAFEHTAPPNNGIEPGDQISSHRTPLSIPALLLRLTDHAEHIRHVTTRTIDEMSGSHVASLSLF
ncbi:hypothetical protein F2P81_002980 [Scophthalmus maximus]|uniref:Uncharacterized protein n=1 Tax=Scophthalmus maximus TaxID=52904 RepID=A0A6A4TPA5_SCOMX|nr:hypothetical protein F2P81_002980 [Scophthalmus maximus]